MCSKESRAGLGVRLPVKRTKTGCFGCRLRKKKCDGRKPTCCGCERANIICSWPAVKSDGSASSEFAWRVKLKARRTEVTTQHLDTTIPGPSFEKTLKSGHLSDWSQEAKVLITDDLSLSILDYYVNVTCPRLTAWNLDKNPYIFSVLPAAHGDNLIMHAVLALGGVHRGYALACASTSQLARWHYVQVVGKLKTGLTAWVTGSKEDLLRLFLASTLLAQYECISGNRDGAIFHHLRASREFAAHAIKSHKPANNTSMLRFLLEVYTYFELEAMLSSPWKDPATLDLVTTEKCLEILAEDENDDFLFGYLIDLYKMIPLISQLGVLRRRELAGEEGLDCTTRYEVLWAKIYNWQAPIQDGDDATEVSDSTRMAVNTAMILHNFLIILLECFYYQNREAQKSLGQQMGLFIDHTLSLFVSVTEYSASAILFWPLMVIGCYAQSADQQATIRRILLSRKASLRMPVLDRGIEVLGWVWSEVVDNELVGLECLEHVVAVRGTDICLA